MALEDPIQVSIVTVCFNNLVELKHTLQSSFNQTFLLKEIIVIDGASVDGTKEYLQTLNEPNLNWISEKDSGIYNAMNKGITKAKGEWIIFMNSGDSFNNKDVLSRVMEQINENVDLTYGNCKVNYSLGYSRKMIPSTLNSLWKGMSFSHQTVIVRTDLMRNNLFDEGYKYCADFNFIYDLYNKGKVFKYLPFEIANIAAGGVSDDKRHISSSEVYRVNIKYKIGILKHLYFILKMFQGFFIVKLKKILPKSSVKFLTEMKYK